MSVNNRQVGGSHYAEGGSLQHWDYAILALDNRYLEGNISKYVVRHRKKNGLQDLEKAKHYTEKLLDVYMAGDIIGLGLRRPTHFPVHEFTVRNGLNTRETFVTQRLTNWRSREDLLDIMRAIDGLMVDARAAANRLEAMKAGGPAIVVVDAGQEPTSGYVNQD